MNRRHFLKGAATAAAAVPLTAFMQRAEAWPGPHPRSGTGGYGPLAPKLDQTTGLPLLALPAGFSYLSFGWRGDALANGTPTPGAHDGMAAFRAGGHRVRLVRNHELGRGTAFGSPLYDPEGGGGTTTLEFDTQAGELVEAMPSLCGTLTQLRRRTDAVEQLAHV